MYGPTEYFQKYSPQLDQQRSSKSGVIWDAGDEQALQLYDLVKCHLPCQRVGKGCQKSICPWALWLSKVITALQRGFEAIYPLHHSGVVRLVERHHTGRAQDAPVQI